MYFGQVNRDSRVCKFYLEGKCKFGSTCKNEHPRGQEGTQGSNRFAALGDQNRGRNAGVSNDSTQSYNITAESIRIELGEERPIWPLSSYAPGRNPPRQLLDAEFEQSPEEMRLLHYIAVANGNPQDSAQKEASALQSVNQAVQRILADVDGAIKYVLDGANVHPNRIDMTNVPFGSGAAAQSTGFGASSTTGGSSFGQPSSLGRNAQSTGFTSTTGGAFGQPSAFGKQTTSSFEQRTSMGQQSSAFGQASSLGQKPSAFGQASALGQNTSAFGQPSISQGTRFGQSNTASQTTSAFGQPSSLGQTASSFGQPTASGQASAFGKPSALGATSSFGKPAFGQPTGFGAASQTSAFGGGSTAPAFGQAGFAKASPFATNTTQSDTAFGQLSAFGAAAGNSASPFAAAAAKQGTQQSTGAFGQASTSVASTGNASPFASATNDKPAQQGFSGFGQPSAFGAAAAKPSSFVAAPQIASPFAQQRPATSFGQASNSQNLFGSTSQQTSISTTSNNQQTSSRFASSQPPAAATSSQSAAHLGKDAAGNLVSFKGQAVSYDESKKTYNIRRQDNREERIWFPNGPPAPIQDAEAGPEAYVGDLGQALSKIYLYVKQNGLFEDGIVPEIPPKSEWISFDF